MYAKEITVGFSGHRKLAHPEVAAQGMRAVLDRLASWNKARPNGSGDRADYSTGRAAGCGSLAVVCSAASGGDTLFLEEVAQRKLPFDLILPFAKARFERDFTPGEWRRVLPFFDLARSIQEITGAKSDKEAYLQTGLLTVEKSDVMVFLWNGQPAAGEGGTGNVVAHARKLKKPLLIIEPQTGVIREEHLELLTSGSIK